MATIERVLIPTYDKKGNPSFKSITSPPDDSIAVCYMVPDRVIPVIFIPGVMGSNLQDEKRKPAWLLDSTRTAGTWIKKNAIPRKETLVPEKTSVFRDGKIPEGTLQNEIELTRRGWGEIGFISYAEILVWLENTLNDYHDAHNGHRAKLIGSLLEGGEALSPITKEEISLSYKYRFPVHAVGYNWLDSNAKSAKRLASKIDEFILYYTKQKQRCERVILVTHSMGGLVARYCSEVLGQQSKILGVVHGVMPAIGAASVYRRMKAGTEVNPGHNLGESAKAWLTSKSLGENAAEMTAVLSSAPGPLQLLPGVEYGMNWLSINDWDNPVVTLPKADPYSEIYTVRHKWWGLCNDQLINPLDKEKKTIDVDWENFTLIIRESVKSFHEEISQRYHPNSYVFYGADSNFKAYGTVKWQRKRWGNPRYQAQLPSQNDDILNAASTRDDGYGAVSIKGAAPKELEGNPGHPYPTTGIYQYAQHSVDLEISLPDEIGDGTVPERSGRAPREHVKALVCLQRIGHEPAYKNESRHAQLITLYGIVKIAQAVQNTSLAYK